jgi:AcrR family transcriptional regulator
MRRGTAPDPAARIVSAAEACFARFGVGKTTMDDVAREAGLSRPTIYRHFASRDDLLVAVVAQRTEQLLARAGGFIDSRPTLASKVSDGLVRIVGDGLADPVTRLLANPHDLENHDGLNDGFRRAVELTTALWRPILEQAQYDGEIAADLDLDELGTWFTIVSLILTGRAVRGSDGVEAQRRTVERFVVPALRGQQGG